MKAAPRALVFVLSLAVFALAAAPVAGAADAPASCAARSSSPVFAPWLDGASYFLAANGGFEQAGTDWTLAGGASVATENEAFRVHDSADNHSLNLPAGSSATSRSMCVSVAEPTVRLFVKAPSTLGSALLVQATVRDSVTGLAVTIPYVVLGGVGAGRWAPTLPIVVTSALDLVGAAQLTVTVTPIGIKANWQVDDVYVDPFKSR